MLDEDDLLRRQTFDTLDGTVAIIGAGFSEPASVPPTSRISERFLNFARDWPTPRVIQEAISRHLEHYWQEAFDYAPGKQVPSFEDHFTLLDLTANAGHNLGHYLTPARLRALRRISIHRVFDILDNYRQHPAILTFLDVLARSEHSAVIPLNWDTVVENHLYQLGHRFHYDIPGEFDIPALGTTGDDTAVPRVPLVKLHGSANWLYCDSCHLTLFGSPGTATTALHDLTFIEARDFHALGDPPDFVSEVQKHKSLNEQRTCRRCGARHLGARVATFSYAKAFDFYPFQAAWDAALWRLMDASQWIFIGYSLPEADFAFRHLLKVAQMNSLHHGPKRIWVVVKENGNEVAQRYRRFFGIPAGCIHSGGLESWVSGRFPATLQIPQPLT